METSSQTAVTTTLMEMATSITATNFPRIEQSGQIMMETCSVITQISMMITTGYSMKMTLIL